MTRACALACRHCRASAQPTSAPNELSAPEAQRVVAQLADLAPAVLVLTGGDPMMRPDLFAIVEEATRRGLRVAVSPSATALATRARLARLQDLGVSMIQVSLDGACAATHDAFRGFPGTFQRSLRLLRDLQTLGLPAQVGTTVTRHTAPELPAMAALMAEHGVRMWNCFFLVPTGRARAEEMVDAAQAERIWDWLADLSQQAAFGVRTTAAPQYRRTLLRRKQAQRGTKPRLTGAGYAFRGGGAGTETRGVNDGKGFLFIDRTGNVCPSGFLQLPAGNVRTQDLARVYREADLFRRLRDLDALEGRCGRCTYADLCGGSRARAYATTGSYLGDDPLCTFSGSS